MKIEDYDMSKPRNRKRMREIQRKSEIDISEFPRSSSLTDIITCCEKLYQNQEVYPEDIGRSGEKSIEDVFHTMKLMNLLDSNLQPLDGLKQIAIQTNNKQKMNELVMIALRSDWVRNWKTWEKRENIFDMKNLSAINFLKSVTYGKNSTISQRSSHMNTLMRTIIQNHPSKNCVEFPDTIHWSKMKRQDFSSESIFETEKLIPAIKRISENADYVRVGTGYLSIQGYDLVARNLDGSQVRLLVGSADKNGRMAISDVVSNLRNSLVNGPVSIDKISYARKMREELIGGGLRVRSLKTRHTPDFHAKVQIYDRSAVVSGSANLSYNGLIKNIESCEVIVNEDKVKYYIEHYDDYFREAIPIEDEVIEMLDESWALSSEELIDPKLVYLRILLEMYGDKDGQDSIGGVSLADYQEYSVNKALRDLNEHKGSLLVSPTGTGKTMMGSIIARRMRQMNKISRIFVIAPNEQILDKWEEVFLKLRIPFKGIPISEFREQTRDWERKLEMIKKSLCNEDLIIVDECHTIRNEGRNGSVNMMNTIGKPTDGSAYRLFLTATPISKSLEEINNLLEFTHGSHKVSKPIDVSTATTITYLTHNLIAQKFAKVAENGYRYVDFSGEKRYFAKKHTQQLRYDSTKLDEIIPIIKNMKIRSLVRLPSEQITIDGTNGDSPGRQQELLKVHLSRVVESSPAAGLKYVTEKLDEDLENKYYEGDKLRYDLEKINYILTDIVLQDPKLDFCIENIRGNIESGEPILIFCEYKDTINYLKNRLEKEFGVIVETVTGDDSKERRKELCIRFSPEYHGQRKRKSDPKILIATDALMEGVDLPDAKVVVNYDLWWAPLKLVQRVGRLDRPTTKKRTFRAVNMIPSTEDYDSLFQLCSRLDDRSGIYREMADIEVYRNHTRDLDNVDSSNEIIEEESENSLEDKFATKVLGHLAKANDIEKKNARKLPLGTTSNYISTKNVGIISVVKDGDGYAHLLSNYYENEWGKEKLEFDNQEDEINLAYPLEDDLPVKIPNVFFNRHENMLNQLAKKYNCEIDDLTPIVNLILS